MASPMVAASSPRLLDPQKKAHFNLQLSDKITKPKNVSGEYSGVKFNHKPQQTASIRTSTITQSTGNQYSLALSDKDKDSSDARNYVFRGKKTHSRKSYVLIFDPAKQTATLEPLSAAYSFNLKSTPTEPSSSKLAQSYPQIQLPKNQDGQDDADDLFNEDGRSGGASDSEPDAQNPYDYRHFLCQSSGASSPDIHSSVNTPRSDFSRSTPLVQAHKPPQASTSKIPPKARVPTASQTLAARKRKSPPPPYSATKKSAPTVRLDRRASTRPTDPPPKAKKPAIKSAEIIHSSDDSSSDHDDDGPTALTIEDPDVPSAAHAPRALASLGLGQSLGLGGSGRGFLKSPSNGPISLHSAANSVSGSPEGSPFRKATTSRGRPKDDDDDVIDFGDMGGVRGDEGSEEEDDGYVEDDEEGLDLVDADGDADADVEEMELGPPVQVQAPAKSRRMSVSALVQEEEADGEEEDEDADFEAEMMQGLMSQEEEGRRAKGLGVQLGGESESESEEE